MAGRLMQRDSSFGARIFAILARICDPGFKSVWLRYLTNICFVPHVGAPTAEADLRLEVFMPLTRRLVSATLFPVLIHMQVLSSRKIGKYVG